jgi:hypothetical protein
MLDWLLFSWFERKYWRDRGGAGEGADMTDRWW